MAAYSAYTDLELTALLRDGDKFAFTEIYGRFKGKDLRIQRRLRMRCMICLPSSG
jgi:hypothetical protein